MSSPFPPSSYPEEGETGGFSDDASASVAEDIQPFEAMIDPPLSDRVRAFEMWLESESCQNDGGCIVMSVSRRMCAPCRIRLHFFHCTHNAEAYEGTSGAIPRASTTAADAASKKEDSDV